MRQLVLDQASQPVRNLIRATKGQVSSQWQGLSNVPATITDDVIGGRNCVKISFGPSVGTRGSGAGTIAVVRTPGTYTLMARIMSPTALKVNFVSWGRSSSPTNGPILVPGVWTEIRWSWSENVVANRNVGFGVVDGTVGDEVLYVEQMMVVEGSDYTGPFIDGDSPGGKWAGTPGSSDSVGYPWALNPKIVRQEITNMIRNPMSGGSLDFITGTNGSVVTPSTVGTWGASMAVTRTGTGDAFVNQNLAGLGPGKTYTISYWAWSNGPTETYRSSIVQESGAGYRQATSISPSALTSTPQRVSSTFTLPTDWHTNTRVVLRGPLEVNGETIYYYGLMITEGNELHEFADAYTPGRRWNGTAYASTSTGYPYTLEQIAGKPLASLDIVGSTAVPKINSFQGRTIYHVYNAINTNDHYVQLCNWHDASGLTASTGMLRVQSQMSGANGVSARIDTANGNVNGTAGSTTIGRSPGLHVVSATINDGLTGPLAVITDNSSEAFRSPITPGDGFVYENPRLTNTSNPGLTPVTTIVYGNYHDLNTRRRVMAWLARKHGAPIVDILEDIAGPPAAVLTSPGAIEVIGHTSYRARTMYVVHNVVNSNSAYYSVARWGGYTSLGGVVYGGDNTGGTALRARFDTVSGASDKVSSILNARTPGIHVASASMAEGMTSGGVMVDNSNEERITFVPGSGIQPAHLVLGSATASDIPIAAYAYWGEHDVHTKRRVMAALARMHGATPPTGY